MTNRVDMRNVAWSEEELNMLVDLAGRTPRLKSAEIATHLGRTAKGVQVKLSNLKTAVQRPHTGTAQKDATKRNIAALSITRIEILRNYKDKIMQGGEAIDFPSTQHAPKSVGIVRRYLRNVTYHKRHRPKELGAGWDGMCWYIHDHLPADVQGALMLDYGPVHLGVHTITPSLAAIAVKAQQLDMTPELYQWSKFVSNENYKLQQDGTALHIDDLFPPEPTFKDLDDDINVMDLFEDDEDDAELALWVRENKAPVRATEEHTSTGTNHVKPSVKPIIPKITNGTSTTQHVPAYLSGTPTIIPTEPRKDAIAGITDDGHYVNVRVPKVLIAMAILLGVGWCGWMIGVNF